MDLNSILQEAVAKALEDLRQQAQALAAKEQEQALVMTIAQLAEKLCVSDNTMRREAKKPGFPVMMVQNRERFFWPDVLEYYRRGGTSPIIDEEALAKRQRRRAFRKQF